MRCARWISQLAIFGRDTTQAKARSGAGAKQKMGGGMTATLSDGRAEVAVVIRPVMSDMPSGTTLRVELLCERRGSELRADVTAEADSVHVRVWTDGVECLSRHFLAARRGEVDLLAESIEAARRDAVTVGTLQMAAKLVAAARGDARA